jgi:hypothetical protein
MKGPQTSLGASRAGKSARDRKNPADIHPETSGAIMHDTNAQERGGR